MINSVFFFMSPTEASFQYPHEMSRLPMSLGVGVLCGYLKEKGLTVKMNDLNVTLATKFSSKEEKDRFEIFYNYEKFEAYIRGEENEEVDKLMEDFLEGIDVDSFDSYGVSIGGDFSFLQINGGFILAKYLKKKYGKPIFIGGNNISFLYIFRDVFKGLWEIVLKEFDFIIKGAGERVIWDIIKAINDEEDMITISNTCGLVRLIGPEIVSNTEYRPIVVRPDWDGLDLSFYKRFMLDDSGDDAAAKRATADNLVYYYKWPDTFAESAGQMVNKYNKAKGKNITPKLIIPYIFNYNCPFSCAFCTQSDFDRGSVIGGDPDQVFDDIVALMEKYNTNYFYFLNNAFNFSPRFVDEFCKKVIREGLDIHWSDCGRFNNLTYERLKLMKEAGCTKLIFGFETGSKKMIDLIDKKIDLDQAVQVLEWCHELGIWADLEIIIGLPQEYDEDFKQTCDFLSKYNKYINYFWVNEYFVIPNSLIGRYPERYGIELIKDKTNYKKLLDDNLRRFRENSSSIMTFNSRLYGFNEINGKKSEELSKINKKRVAALSKIQKFEFRQVASFYKMLLEKQNA